MQVCKSCGQREIDDDDVVCPNCNSGELEAVVTSKKHKLEESPVEEEAPESEGEPGPTSKKKKAEDGPRVEPIPASTVEVEHEGVTWAEYLAQDSTTVTTQGEMETTTTSVGPVVPVRFVGAVNDAPKPSTFVVSDTTLGPVRTVIERKVELQRMRTVRRQIRVTATLRAKSTANRGAAPPPLSSGMTKKGDDIGELAELNNGHVIALELGGADDYRNIVPMVRWFNQSGAWRKVERKLGALLPTGGRSKAANKNSKSKLVVPPAVKVTVHLAYHLEGDPRVPVCLYVQVWRGTVKHAHYLVYNEADGRSEPTLEEVTEFTRAHTALGLPMPQTGVTAPVAYTISPEKRKEHAGGLFQIPGTVPPCIALHWLYCDAMRRMDSGELLPFGGVLSRMLGDSIMQRKPFTSNQRELIRRYNYWRNGNKLVSDARSGVYAADKEKNDLYEAMSDSGGRSFPEADHILPAHQNGWNGYDNVRLISCAQNHIYRDKIVRGKKPLEGTDRPNTALEDFPDDRLSEKITANHSHYLIAEHIANRRAFLQWEADTVQRQLDEEALADAFAALALRHAQGVSAFKTDYGTLGPASQALRDKITAFGTPLDTL